MNEPILNSQNHLSQDSSDCHQVSPTAWYSILMKVEKIFLWKNLSHSIYKFTNLNQTNSSLKQSTYLQDSSIKVIFSTFIKIEYHAVGDTWWQSLLSCDK